MDKITLKAQKRELTGSGVKKLRREGTIPANVFGKSVDSFSIQLNQKEFELVFDEAGETGVITLDVDGENHPVLVSDIQVHPVSQEPIHVDFRQVNLKEKIEASVPVELTGESPAEKAGNLVVLMVDEVLVEALPTDLPEKFLVDISTLTEVDQAIFVKDLTRDEKVEIKTDPELIIAKVEEPQKEEVIETPVVEGEAPAEGVTETPAEGGEQPTEEAPQE